MAYTRCRSLNPVAALTSSSLNTQVIDASNDGAGMAFIAPKTGNISKVGFNITAKAGTPPTYRIGIEGIAATRTPDGTYKASGTSYVDNAPSATGWAWYTLGAAAAVTAGDSLCASVRYQSGTIDGSNNITVAQSINAGNGVYSPYSMALTAGTWAFNALGVPCIAVQYDDGTTIVGCPYSSLTNTAWNSGSSPKFRGNLWTPQASFKSSGLWIPYRVPNNGDFKISVYEGTSGTAMASGSVTVDPDVVVAATANAYPIEVRWGALLTHTASTNYRFVIEPTTVNNNTTFVEVAVPDSASLAQWGGQDWKKTTASTAGTWTDTANSFFPMFPVIEEVDIPSGSGGGAMVIGG